jgi:hypothetical protein
MKKLLLLALAFFHLAVIASGIPHKDPRSAWLRRAKGYYQIVTGAGGGFGFFSPNIGNQFRIRFEVSPAAPKPLELTSLVNHEVALRVINMNRFFVHHYEDEKAKRAIAASLTAHVFRAFPQAESVSFVASYYRLPTMTDYRDGKRPSSEEVYRARFVLPERRL